MKVHNIIIYDRIWQLIFKHIPHTCELLVDDDIFGRIIHKYFPRIVQKTLYISLIKQDNLYSLWENDMLKHTTYQHTAKYGSINILKHLIEKNMVSKKDKSICAKAARYGHLEYLKYAHDNGFQWDKSTCIYAAKSGKLECLRYAHENGCPWDELTPVYAARNNHIDCLDYAYQNGCRIPINIMHSCVGTLKCLKYGHHKGWKIYWLVYSEAARVGNLECLKFSHENGSGWSQRIWAQRMCKNAAMNGNIECLKYLHENNCPWDQQTCNLAALNGNLECLKYARENGCPWNSETCYNAAKNGNIKCLRFSHENGCPWDEHVCSYAANGGHIDCLKYARERSCPWDTWTTLSASKYGHIDCLEYSHKNGCVLKLNIWYMNNCDEGFLRYENNITVEFIQSQYIKWGTHDKCREYVRKILL